MIRQAIYNYKLTRFYKKILPRGAFCFDIGANVGKKSKVLLQTGAKVIAFEPQQECSVYLDDLSEKHPEFTYYPLAIGKKNEEVELYLSNHSEIATLSTNFVELYTNELINWKEKRRISSISINQAIQTHGLPYFCKLDIEGYEFEVLSSLKYEIPLIEFEMIGGFIAPTLLLLQRLNGPNTTYNYTINERPFFSLKKWVQLEAVTNILTNFSNRNVHANIFVRKIDFSIRKSVNINN